MKRERNEGKDTKSMKIYQHTVQYYETDKMGIVHHSNYIRWMEEARTDFLEQVDCSYKTMEENGIVSPVVSVDCQYKNHTTYGDVVAIEVYVEEFKGIKLKIGYIMKKDDVVVTIGHSEHCFLDKTGKIMNMKKEQPKFYEIMNAYLKE